MKLSARECRYQYNDMKEKTKVSMTDAVVNISLRIYFELINYRTEEFYWSLQSLLTSPNIQ